MKFLIIMIGNKKEVVIKRKNKAEDLDAGNRKVHTIAEIEKMLEAIKW